MESQRPGQVEQHGTGRGWGGQGEADGSFPQGTIREGYISVRRFLPWVGLAAVLALGCRRGDTSREAAKAAFLILQHSQDNDFEASMVP